MNSRQKIDAKIRQSRLHAGTGVATPSLPMTHRARVSEPQPLEPVERTDYSEFHTLLKRRRDELLGRESNLREQIDQQRALGGAPGDEADMSVVDLNADYFMKLSDRQKEELMQIREALQRIHVGTYGECEVCEEPIGRERLRKVPTATMCIECKSLAERKARVDTPNPTPKL